MGAQCLMDPKLTMMARRYHIRTISVLVVAVVPMPIWSVEKWCRAGCGEIVANSSDLKHVLELLGCSYGLGVVILAATRRGVGF